MIKVVKELVKVLKSQESARSLELVQRETELLRNKE